jgi:DNA-binding transcriptional LysR family regulator
MIDLRRLRVLQAVSQYGTVTEAARAVHMTPSAASQQIRALGRELGVVLLEPHGRRVRLSTAARSLLAHAEAIEARWQQAQTDLAAATSSTPSGLLRLCGFPTAVSALLAPLAAQLAARWPAVKVEIREAEPVDCFELLFAGDTDLALVEATPDNPPVTDGRFDQQHLLDDPFDLLTTPRHPAAGRHNLRLEELADQPWILAMPGSSTRQHILAACTSAGFSPRIAHQAREWSVVAALVARNLGIALIPRRAQLPPEHALERTPLTGSATPSRRFLTVTRRGSHNHPTIAAALGTLHHQTPTQHQQESGNPH